MPLAGVVHEPEVELRSGDTLIGGQAVPAHRFGVVPGNSFAPGVHAPEVELCLGVTLLGFAPERIEIFLCREGQ